MHCVVRVPRGFGRALQQHAGGIAVAGFTTLRPLESCATAPCHQHPLHPALYACATSPGLACTNANLAASSQQNLASFLRLLLRSPPSAPALRNAHKSHQTPFRLACAPNAAPCSLRENPLICSSVRTGSCHCGQI